MESLFCSLCSQLVVDKTMAFRVSTIDHFAKIFEHVRENFYFCIICHFYADREILKVKKIHEIIMEKPKITLVFAIELVTLFAKCVNFFPERTIDGHFLTLEHFFKKRKSLQSPAASLTL